MTREELKGKQTPGIIMFSTAQGYPCLMREEHPQWNTADVSEGLPNGEEETRANAALYAEAHNVANRTGMWPLDMVERIRELEEAANSASDLLKMVGASDSYARLGPVLKKWIEDAHAILNKNK